MLPLESEAIPSICPNGTFAAVTPAGKVHVAPATVVITPCACTLAADRKTPARNERSRRKLIGPQSRGYFTLSAAVVGSSLFDGQRYRVARDSVLRQHQRYRVALGRVCRNLYVDLVESHEAGRESRELDCGRLSADRDFRDNHGVGHGIRLRRRAGGHRLIDRAETRRVDQH